MKIFCALLILFAVIIIIVGIIKVHELPGEIALRRNHPQHEAIRICSLLGLIIFPFWMVALLWAYMKPVMPPITLDSGAIEKKPVDTDGTDEKISTGVQA